MDKEILARVVQALKSTRISVNSREMVFFFFFAVVGEECHKFQEKEKTNSGYKHNNKVSHGIFNLTFRMLQHTSSEVTVTKTRDEVLVTS